jgi:RNA polymerase-binding transcription factor DksA
MHSQEFIQRMKERLLEEKERLSADLAALSTHTEMGDDEDENASEYEIDEVNHDIAATIKADLEKIEAALKKAEDGTYGMTEDGKEISEARLEVIPWADTAIEE